MRLTNNPPRHIVLRDPEYCAHCEQYAASHETHAEFCSGELETRAVKVTTSAGKMTYDLTFRAWKKMVDRACERISGLTTDDLGDCNFWDWWNAGTGPYAAAVMVLRENDFPFDE